MPSLRTRLEHAIKSAASLPYPRANSGWVFASGFLYGWPRFDNLTDPWPRTNYNRTGETFDLNASAGSPHDNSVVAICLGKIANCFSEPALEVVERQEDGGWESVEDHPLLDRMAWPNDWDDLNSLGTAWSASYKVDGNAYLVLSRTRGGEIEKIDWVRPDLMEPRSEDPHRLITHYVYHLDGKELTLAAEDVLHWRYGKDPNNPRLGCSKFKMLMMELASDNEAGRYSAAILHNLGVAGGMLAYDGEGEGPTAEEAALIEARYTAKFTGGGRGRLFIPTFPAKYTEMGRSPEEMALDLIREVPTARLCAALDVNPIVAGLAESSSYANKAEAREEFWDDCMVPLGTRFTDGLTRYLLPLYGDEIRGARRRRVRWNYDEVRALQPDMDKISARKVREWQADGITLNQFLEAIGEEALPEEGQGADPRGKLYYSEFTASMKKASEPEPKPQMSPPESAGDEMAVRPPGSRIPSNERTPPFGAEAGLNGKSAPAAKATLTDASGRTLLLPDGDVGEIARREFEGLEDFWAGRKKRWESELEGEE